MSDATIDAAQWHVEAGVGDDPEASASWHITTFLLWAAERGLLAQRHLDRVAALRAAPTDYLWDQMGGKLLDADLTPEGAMLAQRHWDDYGHELADLCLNHDVENVYHLAVQPNVDELRGWIFEYLDGWLA